MVCKEANVNRNVKIRNKFINALNDKITLCRHKHGNHTHTFHEQNSANISHLDLELSVLLST